jgi:nucleotide-binding universal stress UspA family protein
MIEIRRILCPVDFSDHSRSALDQAIAIARWYDSTVTVVHVFSPPVIAAYGPLPVAFEPVLLTPVECSQLLASCKRFIAAEAAPGVPVDAVIRQGNVAAEILDHATKMDADLLVIGTHGRSGFERLILGSVTEKVLRKARCPVLTVPRRVPDAVPAGPVIYRSILCPVDFSESSLHALDYAMSLAQEADGQLAVLHVMSQEFDNVPADIMPEERITVLDFWRQREEVIRRSLTAAVPADVSAYCTIESLLAHGKPWREILRVADERKADLIVMGVQGRAAADLMFFGSTTQHVVRQATCPVLTLRRR